MVFISWDFFLPCFFLLFTPTRTLTQAILYLLFLFWAPGRTKIPINPTKRKPHLMKRNQNETHQNLHLSDKQVLTVQYPRLFIFFCVASWRKRSKFSDLWAKRFDGCWSCGGKCRFFRDGFRWCLWWVCLDRFFFTSFLESGHAVLPLAVPIQAPYEAKPCVMLLTITLLFSFVLNFLTFFTGWHRAPSLPHRIDCTIIKCWF